MDKPSTSLGPNPRAFIKVLFTPGCVLSILTIVTVPFWVLPISYVFLRSFRTSPNGLWAWFSLGLLGLTFIATFVLDCRCAMRLGLPVRQARQAVLAREPGAESQLIAAKRDFRARNTPKHFGFGLIALYLMMPPVLALTMWRELQSPDALRPDLASPQERLTDKLKALEHRGIFKPLEIQPKTQILSTLSAWER